MSWKNTRDIMADAVAAPKKATSPRHRLIDKTPESLIFLSSIHEKIIMFGMLLFSI